MKVRRQYSSIDYVKLLETQLKALTVPMYESYIKFIETITQMYDDCFPKTKFQTHLTVFSLILVQT